MEEKKKNSIGIAQILIIGALVITLIVSMMYIEKLKKANKEISTENTYTTSDKYAEYSKNVKKMINNLKEPKEEPVFGNEGIVETADYISKTMEVDYWNLNGLERTENYEVKLFNNQDVYIEIYEDESLYEKYGSRYKITDKAINLIEFSFFTHGDGIQMNCVFIVKEDGSVEYINNWDLKKGEIKLKKISNLKNIVNILPIETVYASTLHNVVAIDIDGNCYDITELIENDNIYY